MPNKRESLWLDTFLATDTLHYRLFRKVKGDYPPARQEGYMPLDPDDIRRENLQARHKKLSNKPGTRIYPIKQSGKSAGAGTQFEYLHELREIIDKVSRAIPPGID